MVLTYTVEGSKYWKIWKICKTPAQYYLKSIKNELESIFLQQEHGYLACI